MDFFSKNGIEPRSVFLLLLFIVLIRLTVFQVEALNWDELNMLAIAQLPLSKLFYVLSIRDFHPPFVHLLLKVWIGLLGSSDFSVHLYAFSVSMLALVTSILFVQRVFNQSRITLLALGLLACNPAILKFGLLVTPYLLSYSLVILSWTLLFELVFAVRTTTWKWVVYGLVTLGAVHSHIMGVFFLPFQWLYVLWVYRQNRQADSFQKYSNQTQSTMKQNLIRIAILSGCILLTILPFLLNLLAPWHVFNTPDIAIRHDNQQLLLSILNFPLNLLFLGSDNIAILNLNEPLLMAIGLLSWFFIFRIFSELLSKARLEGDKLIFFSILPIIGAFVGSLILAKPILFVRTLLFCTLGVVTLAAYWINQQLEQQNNSSQWKGRFAIVLICVLQFYFASRYPLQPEPFLAYAEATKKEFKAGDGIIIYPGWWHLGFFRYYDVREFGLTVNEQGFDPKTENVFHMRQRVDSNYFIVSGDDVLQAPHTKALLDTFLMAHQRVLVIGWNPLFLEMLNCRSKVMILSESGQFVPLPCQLNSSGQ